MTGDGIKRAPNFSDIEIAQSVYPEHTDKIMEVAKRAGIPEKYLEPYGYYKAKVDYNYLLDHKDDKDGKLILVTAINPTPAGFTNSKE
jgi:formate--tetrahydrofolate ligase